MQCPAIPAAHAAWPANSAHCPAPPCISICACSTVFYRERAAGMYTSVPYSLAELLVEIPFIFIQAVIYSLTVYW